MNPTSAKAPRNYAVDLLRILCMFMIVLLHAMCYSNLLGSTMYHEDGLTAPGVLLWGMYAVTYTAVSVYALISGYYLVTQRFRISRIIPIVLQTCFYSWVVAAVFIARGKLSPYSAETLGAIFPISFDRYWFVTGYVGLILLTPVLNFFIRAMNRRQHLGVILLFVLMHNLWRDVLPVLETPFFDNGTYGISLLIGLYLIAAYIRLYVDVKKIRHPFLMFAGGSAFLLITFCLHVLLKNKISLLMMVPSDYYFRNNSTPVLIASIGLFVMFLRVKIENKTLIRIIKLLAPLTLGVYLIHENPFLRPLIWNAFVARGNLEHNLLLPLKALGAAAVVFMLCMLVEFCRSRLFQLLYRCKRYQNLMSKADNGVYALYHKLTIGTGED